MTTEPVGGRPPELPEVVRAGGRAPYEGLEPRQAICEKCAYQFGGVAVRNNALKCPECGHETRLVFPNIARPIGYADPVAATLRIVIAFGVVALALIVVWALMK